MYAIRSYYDAGTTMQYYVDGVLGGTLGSGANGSIAVTTGQSVIYKKPDGWSGVTQVNLNGDKISGNINQFATLTSLEYLNLYNTSVSGDIADISTLTSLEILRLYSYNFV